MNYGVQPANFGKVLQASVGAGNGVCRRFRDVDRAPSVGAGHGVCRRFRDVDRAPIALRHIVPE